MKRITSVLVFLLGAAFVLSACVTDGGDNSSNADSTPTPDLVATYTHEESVATPTPTVDAPPIGALVRVEEYVRTYGTCPPDHILRELNGYSVSDPQNPGKDCP